MTVKKHHMVKYPHMRQLRLALQHALHVTSIDIPYFSLTPQHYDCEKTPCGQIHTHATAQARPTACPACH